MNDGVNVRGKIVQAIRFADDHDDADDLAMIASSESGLQKIMESIQTG